MYAGLAAAGRGETPGGDDADTTADLPLAKRVSQARNALLSAPPPTSQDPDLEETLSAASSSLPASVMGLAAQLSGARLEDNPLVGKPDPRGYKALARSLSGRHGGLPQAPPTALAAEYDDTVNAASALMGRQGSVGGGSSQLVSLAALPTLDLSDIARLQTLFVRNGARYGGAARDGGGSGSLSMAGLAALGPARTEELGRELSKIWPSLTATELASVLDRIDQSDSGCVTFDDLLAFFASHCASRCRRIEELSAPVSNTFDEPLSKPPSLASLGHPQPMNSLLRLPNKQLGEVDRRREFFSCASDGTMALWDGRTLQPRGTLQEKARGRPAMALCAATLPSLQYGEGKEGEKAGERIDHACVAVGLGSSVVHLYDCDHIDAGGEHTIHRYGWWPVERPSTALHAWRDVLGRRMLAAGDKHGAVDVFELDSFEDGAGQYEGGGAPSGNRNRCRVVRVERMHRDWVSALCFTPSMHSGALLSAGMDGVLKCFDLQAHKASRTFRGHAKGVTALGMCEGAGKMLSGGLDHQVLLWSLTSAAPVGTLEGHTAPIRSICIDDKFYQAMSLDAEGSMRVWDLRTMRCVQRLNSRPTEEGGEGASGGGGGSGKDARHKGMAVEVGIDVKDERHLCSAFAFDYEASRIVGGYQALLAWPTLLSQHVHEQAPGHLRELAKREREKQAKADAEKASHVAIEKAEHQANTPGGASSAATPSQAPRGALPPADRQGADGEGRAAPDGTFLTQQQQVGVASDSSCSSSAAQGATTATAGTSGAASGASSDASSGAVSGAASGAVRGAGVNPSSPLTGVLFNGTYGAVVTSDAAGALRLFELASGKLLRLLPGAHAGSPITALTQCERGRRLVSAAHDGSVRLWNLSAGCEPLASLKPAAEGSEATALVHMTCRGSRHVLATGWDRSLGLWHDADSSSSYTSVSVDSGDGGGDASSMVGVDPSWVSTVHHRDDGLSIAYLPPSTIVTGGADGELFVWELDTEGGPPTKGQFRRRIRMPVLGASPSVSPYSSPSNSPLAHRIEALSSAPPSAAPSTASRAVESLLFLRTIAPPLAPLVAACADGSICVWPTVASTGTGPDAGLPAMHFHAGHCDEDALCSVASNESNSLLLSADGGGTVKVWSTSELRNRLQHTSAGNRADALTLLHWWRIRDNGLVRIAFVEVGGGLAAAGSGDSSGGGGLVAAAASDGCATLWTLTGSCIGTFGQHTPWDLSRPASYASVVPRPHYPLATRMAMEAERRVKRAVSRRQWGMAKGKFAPKDDTDASQAPEEWSIPLGSNTPAPNDEDETGLGASRFFGQSFGGDARKKTVGAEGETKKHTSPTKRQATSASNAAAASAGDAKGDSARGSARGLVAPEGERPSMTSKIAKGMHQGQQPQSWAQTLLAGQAMTSGDKNEAQQRALAAATAAKAESTLKRAGTSAEWNPHTFRSAVRTYLTKRSTGPGPMNTRRKAPSIPRQGDAQLEAEKRLERLMKTHGAPADPGFGRVGCWDRVLTKAWQEPPSESRPDQLRSLRSNLDGYAKQRDAEREAAAAAADAAARAALILGGAAGGDTYGAADHSAPRYRTLG